MSNAHHASHERRLPGRGGLPQHVAVIMDGNGRWARRRGLPRIAGHRKGLERVRELVRVCGERHIPYLTLFAFSSENWRRPEQEVRMLLDLFLTALDREVKKLHEGNVRKHLRLLEHGGQVRRRPDGEWELAAGA